MEEEVTVRGRKANPRTPNPKILCEDPCPRLSCETRNSESTVRISAMCQYGRGRLQRREDAAAAAADLSYLQSYGRLPSG